jgi:glycosyltransferase involved in cell wall biosynthesis
MFGGFAPEYARNRVLRLGLERLGVDVGLCRATGRGARRNVALLARWLRSPRPDALLVPEFCHKDVPLARLLASLGGGTLVVDPLVSRYDTKVGDWGTTPDGGFQADHNRRLDRAAVRFADLLLCDTAGHASYFQRHYRAPAERCAVVPVGFDDTVFRPLPPPGAAAPFTVLFFGSYLPLHGVEVIVAAALLLRDQGVRFVLVGGGQTYPRALAARDAGAALELVPTLAPAALVERLRDAHVVLGIFGMTEKAARVVPHKVYQALAVERPVITSDTAALREFFVPGEHLLAVPAGDPAALVAAIARLRDDEPLRRRLAAAGAQRVHGAFAPQAIASRLLEAGRDRLGWEFP